VWSMCRGRLSQEVTNQLSNWFKGPGGRGHAILHPVEEKKAGMVGPMFGGNFGYSSDSRWSEAVRELTGSPHYGAVAIHDRYDTPEDYAALCG
jgi:hypothetical protein